MATRNNALSEITRFWLQECHGLFLRESVPVRVTRGISDIDFVVTSPKKEQVTLLDRIKFKTPLWKQKMREIMINTAPILQKIKR